MYPYFLEFVKKMSTYSLKIQILLIILFLYITILINVDLE